MESETETAAETEIATPKADTSNYTPEKRQETNSKTKPDRVYVNGVYQKKAPKVEFEVDDQLLAVRERNREDLSKFNNSQTTNPEGYIYAITNPAWPGRVKLGCAIDPEDRLRSYQTGDPERAYKLEAMSYSKDRRKSERDLHDAASDAKYNGEWYSLSVYDAITAMTQVSDTTSTVKIVE